MRFFSSVNWMGYYNREDDCWDEEIQKISAEQRETWQDLSTLLETMWGMTVALDRLWERPEDEAPPTTFEQDRVPPPPPPSFVELLVDCNSSQECQRHNVKGANGSTCS